MSLCPLFSCIFLSHLLSVFHFLAVSLLSEASSTDAVFTSLSTPTKRSFESGMPQLYHYNVHYCVSHCVPVMST